MKKEIKGFNTASDNIDVQNYGSYGYSSKDGKAYMTFALGTSEDTWEMEREKMNYNRFIVVGDRINFEGFTIATNGNNNYLPNEAKQYVKYNPFLPEILAKQARMMYGRGPELYIDDIEDITPGASTQPSDGKIRRWVSKKTYPEVWAWLNSWDRDPDLEPLHTYAKQAIHEYYYMEDGYNQYFFNKSRRVNGSMPVRGLKYLNGAHCRLGTTKTIDRRARILDSDLDIVLVGDWTKLNMYDLDQWPRFVRSDPFRYPSSVNYVRDRSFDEDIYSTPTYFYGLKEWIKGTNLNPKYINSYLENSLSAKIHVIIPDAWIKQIEETLKNICRDNEARKTAGKPLQTEFEGVKEIGTDFSYELLTAVINKKIEMVTAVLSGAGKNQGKAYWSRSFLTEHGIEKWTFEDIPVKYSEFIKSVIDFNKESTRMIVAGKGLDPAISNLSNEGVFNSGAQVYYSYLVYLDTLGYAEEFILEDLNRALWLNFPRLVTNNVKIGFKRFAPERQQDTSPQNRIQNNIN